MSRSLWRVVLLLSLVPTLLLWPALHLHPAFEHGGGPQSGGHRHPAVVHVDFFPSSADDHHQHHEGESSPDDAAPRFLSQVTMPALSVRALPPSAPARERILDATAVQELLAALRFPSHPVVSDRDSLPPALDFAFLPTSPRSPPFHA